MLGYTKFCIKLHRKYSEKTVDKTHKNVLLELSVDERSDWIYRNYLNTGKIISFSL